MNCKNLSRKQPARLSIPVRLGVAAVAACFISAPVLSNPLNPTVVNGVATFNQAGNVLTVTNSNGAIINWQKFSIGAGETTHFAQASASSSVLNRVLNDPTAIYGTLSSNGRVWLVNPAGIMVGPGGTVNVAAFVASTLNISNADFLAGRNVFINDGGAGNVINQGEIRTPAGGSVYLIGSNVTNEGLITTPKGETILAAGATVSLIDSATPGVKVDITGSEGNATNLGTITAEAGRIGIAGVIVRNSGLLNASSVVSEGGRVFLKASQDAYVDGNGRIVTTGTRGGRVEVLGNRVAVMDNAEIDASGVNGGGRILVGGDFQGKNPDIQNASVTWFGPDATLKADAKDVGDGGTVIVWADDTTRAYGSISARGGATGGDGGFVEVSGHRYLDFHASVDRRAPHGKAGLLLLDPSNIEIGNTDDYIAYGGDFTGVFPNTFYGATSNQSKISWATISTELGNGPVAITTTGTACSDGTCGDIKFSASRGDLNSSANLSLLAHRHIETQGYDLINIADGGFTFVAGWDGTASPTSANATGLGNIIISGSTIRSAAGFVKLWAGNDIALSNSGSTGTWIQGAVMDVFAGNNLTLTGGGGTPSGLFGPGVMLFSTGVQTVTAVNQILLTAGTANNSVHSGSSQYGGSVAIKAYGNQTISAPTIKLWAGTGGHDNVAAITTDGAIQDIWVTNSLQLTGGSGGNDNYAWIGATGNDTVQTINAAGASITLTGGASGGAPDRENSADIGLSENNVSFSQTVYAGSITINGGGDSATWGGAGFGTDNGNNQSFYVSGDLTMNGGGGSGSDLRAAPAYIGSEYGGGTITLNVGGSVFLNGGSGTAGAVLIGSLDDSDGQTHVNIYSAKDIKATGNTGGVWLGVKEANYSSGSSVTLKAGWNADGGEGGGAPSGFGGDITLSGPVHIQTDGGSGFVSIIAEESSTGLLGNISLKAGTTVYGADIQVVAAGNNEIAGELVSTGDIYLDSGWSDYGGTTSLRGGDLTLTATSYLDAGGVVYMYSQVGTNAPYGGGIITQNGTLLSYDDISMYADRDIRINGSVTTSYGGLYLQAGYSETYGFGGNLVFGSASEVTVTGPIQAYAYSGDESRGDIVQYSGSSIYSDGNIGLYANGNVKLGGGVETPNNLYVYAGLDNYLLQGDPYYNSEYGGNIELGANSQISAGHVELIANRGFVDTTTGNITQSAGGYLETVVFDSLNAYAAGNVDLLGTVVVNNGAPVHIEAGYDYPCGECRQEISGKHITINSLVAEGSSVSLYATGRIIANTQGVGSISADIDNSSSGGIEITNIGVQPGSVMLTDRSTAQSSVSFYNSGDLILDGSTSFETPNGGDILIASDGNLTYYGANIDSYGGSLILGAGGVLNIGDELNTSGSLGIAAPVVYVHGDGGEGGIWAAGDIFLGATQLTIGNFDYTGIYSDANITVNTGTLTMQTGGLFADGDVDITAGSIYGTDWSAITATNIKAKVAGDIRWNDYSQMIGYNDVFLTLSGGSSTVYLNDTTGLPPSSIGSGIPTTVHLNFLGRSSGGVVIDGVETTTTVYGGSGFYANGLPATTGPGGGLVITYASTGGVDSCVNSPDLCKPPLPVMDMMENGADPCASDPDSAQCKALKDEKEKAENDGFGDGESNGKSSKKKVAQCSV